MRHNLKYIQRMRPKRIRDIGRVKVPAPHQTSGTRKMGVEGPEPRPGMWSRISTRIYPTMTRWTPMTPLSRR